LVSAEEERDLVAHLKRLEFQAFQFQGYQGKRRVVSFGLHYDFNDGALHPAAAMPPFILDLRDNAARFAGIPASALTHALVTEYTEGAGIGWHRDRPVFGDVVGISLVSPCRFRLRRWVGSGWQRTSLVLEPRSAYLLRGPARIVWEHSTPPAEELRYSVTFRSVRAPPEAS